MNLEEINSLLDKFLSGKISKEEKDLLDNWYQDFDSHDDITDRMRKDEQLDIRNKMLKAIKEQAFDSKWSKGASQKSLGQIFIRVVSVAASLVLIAAFAYSVYYPSLKPVIYQTDLGEMLILKLPDSTQVTLNGNSRLSYKPNWLGKFDRKVNLEGEAFFEVFHTVDHKRFTINEKTGMGIEVYGTEFNYQVREGVNAVALKSGSVKIMLPDDSREVKKEHFLKPGEMAEFDVRERSVEIASPGNLESYYAWKDGKLIMDYSTLPEIIERLRGTYGISLSLDTSNWRERKVSGTLPLTRDPESLILNLEKLFDIDIEITEQK
ncbi:FecR domain-containing protein [Echinicola marina]|uniref:FecR family protein n=1 Tax=Echinicola marina TaxID=2859768 RepID=UPI001CF62411|nr:FecR domain-containing protein [Echinicola marina]UCS91916.1 FecR domain-containing protein [Echinicola marina]